MIDDLIREDVTARFNKEHISVEQMDENSIWQELFTTYDYYPSELEGKSLNEVRKLLSEHRAETLEEKIDNAIALCPIREGW